VAQNEDKTTVSFEALAAKLARAKDPVEALNSAQQLELRARELYSTMERRSRNPSMKSLFEYLMREEQRHYDNLASWKAHLNGETKTPKVGDARVGEGWDRGTVPQELTSAEQEVLLAAQRAETTAQRFYDDMARVHRKGQLGDVFTALASEEKHHAELIDWLYGEETRFRLET